MKLKFHYFQLLPVLAAGLMVSPLAAQSPERHAGPPRGDGPREAPQPDRIQAAVREIGELRQAGKLDEARAISQRLREAAKNNPELAKQIYQAMSRQRPPVRPNARPDGPPPMMRPDAAGPKPPVMRPKVEAARQAKAGKGEVAKIRHLRQAAEHLSAAGLAEPAAKARAEADRMTAALKGAQRPAPAGKPQMDQPRPDRPMPDKARPRPDAKPEVNGAILGELRKMGKQLGELSARVRKLEAQEKPTHD